MNKWWTYVSALAVCIGIVGGLLTLLPLLVDREWWAENSSQAAVHAGYWVVLMFLLYVISTTQRATGLALPKVRFVSDEGTLLAENTNWISVGTHCAIYLIERDFEILQCTGRVTNIQENDLVQISVQSSDHELITDLQRRRGDILIKPGVL